MPLFSTDIFHVPNYHSTCIVRLGIMGEKKKRTKMRGNIYICGDKNRLKFLYILFHSCSIAIVIWHVLRLKRRRCEMMITMTNIRIKIYEMKVFYIYIYTYIPYIVLDIRFKLSATNFVIGEARERGNDESRGGREGGVRCYDHPPRCVAIPMASREPYFQIVRCVLDWRVRCVCFIVLRCIAVYCGFRCGKGEGRGGRGRVYFAIGTRVADWLARVVDLDDCNAAGFERFRWESFSGG